MKLVVCLNEPSKASHTWSGCSFSLLFGVARGIDPKNGDLLCLVMHGEHALSVVWDIFDFNHILARVC